MRKIAYPAFAILLATTFAITGFDFGDPSFQKNQKEYILLGIAVILCVIYLINRFSKP